MTNSIVNTQLTNASKFWLSYPVPSVSASDGISRGRGRGGRGEERKGVEGRQENGREERRGSRILNYHSMQHDSTQCLWIRTI